MTGSVGTPPAPQRWRKQRLSRDAFGNPGFHGLHSNTGYFGGVSKNHPTATSVQPDRLRRVSILLFVGGPDAIFFRVRAVVVDALDGQTVLVSGFHVSKKGGKGVPPLWADRDTPAPVSFELFGVGIDAAPLHAGPNGVDPRSAHVMRGYLCNENICPSTSTTPTVSAPQARRVCVIPDCSAFAPDLPLLPRSSFRIGRANNGPFPERLTDRNRPLRFDASAPFAMAVLECGRSDHAKVAAIALDVPSLTATADVGKAKNRPPDKLLSDGNWSTLSRNLHAVSPSDRCGGQRPRRADNTSRLRHYFTRDASL